VVTSLQKRVGIATGLVAVGDLIGSGASQEQAIVGETPNLAALAGQERSPEDDEQRGQRHLEPLARAALETGNRPHTARQPVSPLIPSSSEGTYSARG
jgi:hypothetical protein